MLCSRQTMALWHRATLIWHGAAERESKGEVQNEGVMLEGVRINTEEENG